MLFEALIRKITAKKDKRKLILEIIGSLRVDDRQKELYRQAIEVLDAQGMEGLYQTLVEVMKRIDGAEVKSRFSQNEGTTGLRRKEAETKIREEHSAGILLDNI